MPKSLESRLNDLIHEITEIKKQIILEKSNKLPRSKLRGILTK